MDPDYYEAPKNVIFPSNATMEQIEQTVCKNDISNEFVSIPFQQMNIAKYNFDCEIMEYHNGTNKNIIMHNFLPEKLLQKPYVIQNYLEQNGQVTKEITGNDTFPMKMIFNRTAENIQG